MYSKLTSFLAIFLILAAISYSQWQSNLGTSSSGDLSISNAKGLAITVDSKDNSYVTGYISTGESGTDIVLIKFDAAGDTIWLRYFNGTANSDDEGSAIAMGPDGSIYVVGTSNNIFTANDIILLKYNASGDLLWHSVFSNNSEFADDSGKDIAVDIHNNIFITGYVSDSAGKTSLVTQMYSADGLLLWSSTETYTFGNSEGVKIICDDSGNSYTVGNIPQGITTDMILIKYDNYGNKIFTETRGGEGEDKAWGIAVDGDSFIYITGFLTNSSANTDCYTAKFNPDGTLQWEHAFDGPGSSEDKAWGIAVDDDSFIYITGHSTDSEDNVNFVTIKYDSSGAIQWTSFYDGTGSGRDQANALGLIKESGFTTTIAVVGESWGVNGNFDFAAVRYSAATGDLISANRYSMTDYTDDRAIDVAISVNDGRIYLTGYSQHIIENMTQSSYITGLMYLPLKEMVKPSENTMAYNFKLNQNYPNPFNPSTKITFSIPVNSQTSLIVYDMLGRTVDVLIRGELKAGSYELIFSNSSLASGVYFYELNAGKYRDIKKMILLK